MCSQARGGRWLQQIMQLIFLISPQILNKFKRNDVEKVSCVTKSTKLQENCFGELNSASPED